jgi:hypothetical protein
LPCSMSIQQCNCCHVTATTTQWDRWCNMADKNTTCRIADMRSRHLRQQTKYQLPHGMTLCSM